MRRAHLPLQAAAALLCLCLASAALAETPKPPPGGAKPWMTVGDDTLATMRGGFDLGSGLMVAFGISRAISVNGVLLAATTFNVPDIARITPVQAAAFERQISGASLVQVGPNNSVILSAAGVPAAGAPASGVPAGTTVVQNTLDNQTIQTRTLIDATTNAMSLVKGLNSAGALRDALLRGR